MTRKIDQEAPVVIKRVTRPIDPQTPHILQMWTSGASVEAITAETGKPATLIRILVSYHKARRPAWYLAAVRANARLGISGATTQAHRGA